MSSRDRQLLVNHPNVSSLRLIHLLVGLLVALLAGLPISAQKAQRWPPIKPEDFALPDPSADPGAPAIILEYQVLTDDVSLTETTYKRIKILREEGRKYGDIQIPYYQHLLKVEDIRARVTSPDGHSTEFTGPIYDSEFIKTKKYRLAAKTFSLPNVQVGSIIEYYSQAHFYLGLPPYFVRPADYKLEGTYAHPAAEWTVQQDLFVRHALFRLIPSRFGTHLTTYLHEIPRDALQRNAKDGTIQLEVNNVAAFQREDYSAPEGSLKTRADLFYTLGNTDPYHMFWESVAKREAKGFDAFAGKSKTIEREAAAVVSPGDTDEAKLRKIYARVQQIRNLSFETTKTRKELKQENLKENKSAEDVLSHGYGYFWEINYTFAALARAAGFQAFPVHIASRDQALFTPQRFDVNQLNANIAEVRLGDTDRYFDPATVYCPFGLLPWAETAATGVRLDATLGGMITTPAPGSSDTVTSWKADLKLDPEGNLQGKLFVALLGQDALKARIDSLELDGPARQKYLENLIQPSLPHGSSVNLVSAENWQGTDGPLKADYDLLIPNFAARAGKRLMVPRGIFHTKARSWLTSASRVNPVYFEYPLESYEEITLDLPAGFTIESLPPPQSLQREAGQYEFRGEVRGDTIHLYRSVKQSGYYFPATSYPSLRSFYDLIWVSDEQQIILNSLSSLNKQ